MKTLFTAFLFLPLAALAQGVVGDMLSPPTMHKFEAEVVAKAAKAATPEQARDIMLECADKSWAGAALFFNIGNACYKMGDYLAAAKHYEAALAKQKFFHAYKNLGFAYDAAKMKPKARDAFASALAISGGSDVQILLWFADFYASSGDFGAALAMCNQALVYKPNDGAVMYAKCRFLVELELYAEAEKLSAALYAKTSDPRYLRLRIRALLGLSDMRGAAASLELLKASGAANPADSALLADLYFSLGVFREAASLYASLGDGKKLENLSLACVNAGDFPAARRAAEHVKGAQKEKFLGVIEARGGDAKTAAAHLEKYCADNPADMFALAELADALLKLGRHRESSAAFARLKASGVYRKRAMFGILRCALAAEDYFYALSAAREISREYPSREISDFENRLAAHCHELEKSAQ